MISGGTLALVSAETMNALKSVLEMIGKAKRGVELPFNMQHGELLSGFLVAAKFWCRVEHKAAAGAVKVDFGVPAAKHLLTGLIKSKDKLEKEHLRTLSPYAQLLATGDYQKFKDMVKNVAGGTCADGPAEGSAAASSGDGAKKPRKAADVKTGPENMNMFD